MLRRAAPPFGGETGNTTWTSSCAQPGDAMAKRERNEGYPLPLAAEASPGNGRTNRWTPEEIEVLFSAAEVRIRLPHRRLLHRRPRCRSALLIPSWRTGAGRGSHRLGASCRGAAWPVGDCCGAEVPLRTDSETASQARRCADKEEAPQKDEVVRPNQRRRIGQSYSACEWAVWQPRPCERSRERAGPWLSEWANGRQRHCGTITY